MVPLSLKGVITAGQSRQGKISGDRGHGDRILAARGKLDEGHVLGKKKMNERVDKPGYDMATPARWCRRATLCSSDRELQVQSAHC
jgi:hypothetical protein